MKGRTKMTTRINLKRVLLLGTLILSLSGMVGCSTNDSQQETEDNKKTVELQPNELSLEETRVLKPGDIVPEGKEVNRELLEQQGMDYVYVYDVYSRLDDSEIIENSQCVVTTYTERPSEIKSEFTIQLNGVFEYVTYVYTFKNYKIVSVDFVKGEDGKYKKQVTHESGYIEYVYVIAENNIDKDKVKTEK